MYQTTTLTPAQIRRTITASSVTFTDADLWRSYEIEGASGKAAGRAFVDGTVAGRLFALREEALARLYPVKAVEESTDAAFARYLDAAANAY